MQSDLFDKKVKEAADNHHPAYDEQAWTRMHSILDKHLPEEKDRRRGLFFIILLFLLVGGGIVWFTTRPSADDQTALKTENKLPDPASIEKTSTTSASEKTVSNTPGITSNVEHITERVTKENDRNYSENRLAPGAIEKSNSQSNTSEPESKKSNARTQDLPTEVNTPFPSKDDKPSSIAITPVITTEAVEKDTKSTGDTKDEPQTNSQKSKVKKDKSKKPLPLFASLSMGPDISFAGSSSLGSTRLLTGVGLGYTFKDRLTIRMGFYSGRKVYSASPDEYNPPPQFWTYYPYLEKVDANCKIYELPIAISYDFGRSTKQRWFASAAISSVIMKEETYEYYYKYNPSSPTYKAEYTIRNENKHLFSVLTLSGGYKRNLSNRVFIMAEPYMKLSLQGLGYGKVKLNSGGVMVSAGIKPFSYSKPR